MRAQCKEAPIGEEATLFAKLSRSSESGQWSPRIGTALVDEVSWAKRKMHLWINFFRAKSDVLHRCMSSAFRNNLFETASQKSLKDSLYRNIQKNLEIMCLIFRWVFQQMLFNLNTKD